MQILGLIFLKPYIELVFVKYVSIQELGSSVGCFKSFKIFFGIQLGLIIVWLVLVLFGHFCFKEAGGGRVGLTEIKFCDY